MVRNILVSSNKWIMCLQLIQLTLASSNVLALSSDELGIEHDNAMEQILSEGALNHDDIELASIDKNKNPHWDKNSCSICHTISNNKKNVVLKEEDYETHCTYCHAQDVLHKYIHPIGIAVTSSREAVAAKKWSGGLRLDKDKKMTCLTCHDVLDQCLQDRAYVKNLNPRFLREGPYSKRTDICYKCHDADKYEKLNSHQQIDDNGMLMNIKCQLCHVVKKNGMQHSGIEREKNSYPIIPELNNDRALICIRCHKKIDHPTSAFRVTSNNQYRHLVTIKDDKKQRLEQMVAKTGIKLPLEPVTDKIYCGTCHEPHQPGVFKGEEETSLNGTKNRLRANNICTFCHDK